MRMLCAATPDVYPDAVLVTASYRDRLIAVRVLRLSGKTRFRIGTAADVDAPAPTSDQAHTLVSCDVRDGDAAGPALAIHPVEGMTGVVVREGMRVPLVAFGPGPLSPPRDARVELSWGDLAFTVERTEAPGTLPRPALLTRKEAAPYLASTMIVMSLVGLAFFVPPSPSALAYSDIPRWARMLPVAYIPPVPAPLPQGAGGPRGQHGAAGGARGVDAAPAQRRRTSDRRIPETRPIDARGAGRLVGVFEALESTAFRDLVASTSPLLEQGDAAIADLRAVGERDAFAGGLGIGPGRGTGAGPGRGGDLTGVGRLTTIGSCGEACDGGRVPYGRGAAKLLDRRVTMLPQVQPGQSEVRGSLDREIVRRVVRQHVNEIKHCYDVALTRRPSLAGRLTVRFTIDGLGRVLAAMISESTLADAGVESCVAKSVRRWSFPAPQGGGLVMVTYPFTLVTRGEQ